jgi:hypothetical protein
MTHAMKAKSTLYEHGIYAEIIKLEPKMTKRGCAYGISFDCINLALVEDALNSRKIKYSEILSLPI